MKKLIFHIDVNSAFLSWESSDRIHTQPGSTDLRAIPSIIGGDRESRHGIVLAKSIPAKAYGIRTADTIVSALKRCPNLVIVPPNFTLYEKCSRAFMDILSQYSPDIEKCSIDEAFIDMTETCHLFGSPTETAQQIKDRIRDELGFTVNVGISVNKLLSKMASDFQKPDRCHSLFPEEIQEKMWPLPVGELYFVGRSAKKKMELLGIHTIGDLANFDTKILMAHLGEKYGQLIHEYANGIADDTVKEPEHRNKGYGNSITLSQDITSYENACQILLSLSETVGMRLRADHVKCNSVTVEIKDCDFCQQSHQMTLSRPTDITGIIYESACQLLREFWQGTPLRLIGVRTSKVSDDTFTQMNLFSNSIQEQRLEKLHKIDTAMDQIRNRYGMNSIKRASSMSVHLKKHGHDIT